MTRDWAGLEDSSDEPSEEGEAGTGDVSSVAAWATGVDRFPSFREEKRCLADCMRGDGCLMPVRSLNEPAALPGPLACVGVPPDGPRDAIGRGVPLKVALGAVPPLGVLGRLASFLRAGLSLRIDSCEGALGRPD